MSRGRKGASGSGRERERRERQGSHSEKEIDRQTDGGTDRQTHRETKLAKTSVTSNRSFSRLHNYYPTTLVIGHGPHSYIVIPSL